MNLDQIVDDPWAIEIPEFKLEDNPHGVVSQSTFATLFPKYRENYIKGCFNSLTDTLNEYGIKASLDLMEGSISVSTTKKTYDPYIIIKARDVIKLLGRGVPYEHAIKVLQDNISCDIIKIGKMVRKRDRFVRRRQRLIGSSGTTLKAIELLTDCYVLVQGNTVSAVGPYKGLQHVRRVVEDCMNNIHPVYNIKALMIKRELAKDPKLKNENWNRFLPKYKAKNLSKRKKPKKVRNKNEYTPFPPPQPESKVDEMLRTGEYFIKEVERKDIRKREKVKKQEEAKIAKESKRNQSFIPPLEEDRHKKKTKETDKKDMNIAKLKKQVEMASKYGYKRKERISQN